MYTTNVYAGNKIILFHLIGMVELHVISKAPLQDVRQSELLSMIV